MTKHPIPDGAYGGATFINCSIEISDEDLRAWRLKEEQRRQAIGTIIAASELVGVHGLHLEPGEVDDTPEKVCQALRSLGVVPEELAEFYEGGTP